MGVRARDRLDWLTEIVQSDARNASVRVAIALQRHFSNVDGTCWVSRDTLADATGLSVATVKRAIADLRKIGFFTVKSGRSGKANYYRMTLPSGSPVSRAGGQNIARDRVTRDPPTHKVNSGGSGSAKAAPPPAEPRRKPETSEDYIDPAHRPIDVEALERKRQEYLQKPRVTREQIDAIIERIKGVGSASQ